MKKHILTVGLVYLFVQLQAQKSVSYFSQSPQNAPHDRVFCTQKSGQYVYVGGASFDTAGFYYTPSLTKIDTGGRTIWTCSLNKQIDSVTNIYWAGYVENMAMDDSSIYAHVYAISNNVHELWRISASTGSVIWRKTVTDAIVVASADNNTIVYTYNAAVNYYTTDYYYELVDKTTGKSIFTTSLASTSQSAGSCFPVFDTDGSTYIAKGDSVIKYSDPRLSTVVWNKELWSPGGVTMASLQGDALYFAGSGNTFFAGKLNKSDGSVAWMTSSSYSYNFLADMVSDFKVTSNGVYVLGEDMDPGNGYSAYHVAKFNRATGQISWESAYNPGWNPSPSQSAGEASGKSIDVDTLGNVYFTGYEGGNNSRTGVFGVGKYDSTGRLVYHSAIFDGASWASTGSRGMLAYVFGNKVFYFGDLERNPPSTPDYNEQSCDIYMVATDTGSVFNPLHQIKTRALYQEFSNVPDIVNFSTTKYAVLKQYGFVISVELRDSRQGNVIWTKQLSRGFYLAADKMCVTADNKIAVTAISHDQDRTFFDHMVQPDSLYFFKFDSTGTLTQEKRSKMTQNADFRSIQLYANKDSNNVLLFSQVDTYGYDNSLHLFCFEQGTGDVGVGDYMSSVYSPVPGKQKLFYSLSHDTAMHFGIYSPFNSTYQLLDRRYLFKTVSARGWTSPNLTTTGLTHLVHNIAPIDSTTLILLATNDATGNESLIKYNATQHSAIWTITDPTSGYSMDMGSCSPTRVYLAGRKGSNLVIRKVRLADGSQEWEKVIAPTGVNQYYVPMDQKFNALRNQYTIAGYIADTSAITPAQTAFYITVDTNGVIITQWAKTGDYKLQNSLNSVNITQYGQTLIGGALYTAPYGLSGVLIEADSAILQQSSLRVSIALSSKDTVCSGDSVLLVATATGCTTCTYTWSTSPAVNSDSLVVKASGSYTVTVSDGGNMVSANQAVVIIVPAKPIISLSNGVLTASAAPGYQWYLNGQAISGANNQQLQPTVSGSYTVQTTQNGCVAPISNAFIYTLTTNNSPFAVTISASPADTICAGDSVVLTASAAGCSNCTYSWSGAAVNNGASLTVRASGNYTVTATNGIDSASAWQMVIVNARPAAPAISENNGLLISSAVLGNQWYLNGSELTDSVGQELAPSTTGVYTIQVEQAGCKSLMSAPFAFVSGSNNLDSIGKDSVVFYPNPVKDVLHIANKLQRNVHIDIYDMSGAKYTEIVIGPGIQSVDIASYPPGGYYVMVTDDKTGARYSLGILKL